MPLHAWIFCAVIYLLLGALTAVWARFDEGEPMPIHLWFWALFIWPIVWFIVFCQWIANIRI